MEKLEFFHNNLSKIMSSWSSLCYSGTFLGSLVPVKANCNPTVCKDIVDYCVMNFVMNLKYYLKLKVNESIKST